MATALLIVDMQNFFASMPRDPMISNITRLVLHFRSRSMPCIFTQHGHTEAELTPPFKNQLVRKWGTSGSIAVGTEDWKFMPDIASLVSTSPIVHKNTYDAFMNTNLQDLLDERKIERVVVVGVMTDCCCDTTGRSAFNRGFEAWLVSDACASANQAQHKAGLRAFEFAFGDVVTTDAVIKAI